MKLFTVVLGLSVLTLIALPIIGPISKGFVISATVDIKPETLNLNRQGKWITVYIGLPEDYNLTDIDESTIMLEGLFKAEWSNIEDGILMVKFKYDGNTELIDYLWNQLCHMGVWRGSITLRVTGQLVDGTEFSGSDTITVMNPVRH